MAPPHLLVALFDLIAFLATLVTLVFLCKGWKRVFLREVKVLFIALILFTLSYNLCLFLEWSGLAGAYEILENFIGALIPMWWAFVFYAFLQEIAQRELRESEQRYRSVAEDSPGLICSFVPEGKITYVNDAYCDYFVKSREELVGQTFLSLIPEPDRATVMANISSLTVDAPIQSVEYQVISAAGEIRWQRWTNRGLFDEQGRAVAFQAFGEDITERKEAEKEREKLIAELEAKNTELERFTYTVSHDLKSPLITTKGFVGMLKQDLAEGNEDLIAEDMQRISHTTETMERLLDELLELSQIGRIVNPPEKVLLSDLAKEAWTLLSGEPNTRNIKFAVAPDLPVVYGDRIRLREVLQNLIENAVKFMEGQSEPRIEIGVRQDEGENVFYVRDNGVGIDPRFHEKIFGLFTKLNSEAAGTGIGLAIVKRIVEVHGGRIWVESQSIGHGSTFCFTLAAHKEGE